MSIAINNSTVVNQSLDVSALKTGVYMLIIDANGTRQYARFVKE